MGQISSESTDRHCRSHTALVVEDKDAFRTALVIWLESQGQWAVREARNGREALDQVDETVDVFLLDCQMPQLAESGVIEALDETKFEGVVAVLSAYEANQWLNEDHEYATVYLAKPIEKPTFLSMLNRALD